MFKNLIATLCMKQLASDNIHSYFAVCWWGSVKIIIILFLCLAYRMLAIEQVIALNENVREMRLMCV